LFKWLGRVNAHPDRENSDATTPSPSIVVESRQSPGTLTTQLAPSSASGDQPASSANPIASTEASAAQPGMGAGDSQVRDSERSAPGPTPTIPEFGIEDVAGAAESPDTRGLLMRAFDVPESSPWKIRGWIQNSFTYNANGRGNGLNFGVNPNFKADQWMGNQYYIITERPLRQDDTVNFGFRMDNMFGNDWQFTFTQGLFNRAFPNGWFAGYDMPQLYGEMHLPILTPGGLDVKGGRWYTITGFEVVPAAERTLLSVPYSFAYGQPFTHVGVMTTLHLTDKIDLYNGSINGWDRWINQRYIWGYIGELAWTSRDDNHKVTLAGIWGPNQFPSFLPANQPIYLDGYVNVPSVAGRNNPGYHRNDRMLLTLVYNHKWTSKLRQVTGTGAGAERAIPGLGAPLASGVPQNAQARYDTWYGFVNAFLYQFSDTLTGVWRSEVFWDTNGSRTGKLVGDRYYEMTIGAQYKPRDWLLIRPEARYDWSQFHPAYSNDTRKSQFTLGIDVLILF
jgi:hypothetical protein